MTSAHWLYIPLILTVGIILGMRLQRALDAVRARLNDEARARVAPAPGAPGDPAVGAVDSDGART